VLLYINEYKNNVKFLEKAVVAQLVSKFYVLYGTRKFITKFRYVPISVSLF